jgi:hypothetical protein
LKNIWVICWKNLRYFGIFIHLEFKVVKLILGRGGFDLAIFDISSTDNE